MSGEQFFFSELKRRNVYKVAVAYAVVAWLLMQIASQIFPFFEIPNWAVRLVVLLLIIGFPIALILAWAFEATPQGIKRTEAADLIATVYAALDEKDEGFRWLNRAFDEHSAPMVSFTSYPEFRPLGSHPRFADLLRRIGIDPAKVPSRQNK